MQDVGSKMQDAGCMTSDLPGLLAEPAGLCLVHELVEVAVPPAQEDPAQLGPDHGARVQLRRRR